MPITVERNFKASSFLRWNELRPMIDPNRLRVFGLTIILRSAPIMIDLPVTVKKPLPAP